MLIDDSDEDNEYYKFAKEAYVRDHGQVKGILLFKIYKYIRKLADVINRHVSVNTSGYFGIINIPKECQLILQRIAFILGYMINGRI